MQLQRCKIQSNPATTNKPRRLALGLGNACRVVVFRAAADDLGTADDFGISTWSLLFARALLAAPESGPPVCGLNPEPWILHNI